MEILQILGFSSQAEFDKKFPPGSPMEHLREILTSTPSSTTKASFQKIYKNDQKWLQQQIKRILDSSDPRNSQAALGELRAYSDLLDFPWKIKAHGTKKGPDFTLTDQAGHFVNVEVFTMQVRPQSTIDHGETQNVWIEKDQAGKRSKCSMTTKITEIFPYGIPNPDRPGDSTGANMISKICSIKGDGHQADTDVPTLLYIDFQSMPMSYTQLPHCLPFLTWNAQLTAGCIWLAFYGEKGMPIPELQTIEQNDFVTMEHSGRFSRKNKDKFCGALLSFSSSSHSGFGNRMVFFENPQRPILSKSFKFSMSSVPFLNWELSCWKYENFDLKKYIRLKNSSLEMIFNQFCSKSKMRSLSNVPKSFLWIANICKKCNFRWLLCKQSRSN